MSTCKESTEDRRRRFLRAAYYFIGWGVFSLFAGCQSTSSGGALRQAAAAGDTTKVERILARSPGDVNDSDSRSGMTPLEFAVITGDEATVKSLLAHGADVNVYDKLGMNAIAHAIRKDNWTIVQLLLNHNAHLKDVRLLGKGVTPLMVAANEGSQPMVEHLLALGVDPHVHDTEGMTAADFARGNGHRQLAAFLEKRMAAAPTTRK